MKQNDPDQPDDPTVDRQPSRANIRKVTASDIARHAGVGYATAARVLSGNPKYPVSEATRARVLRAAQELGYAPNPFARTLRINRSYIIGICGYMPAPTNQPFSALMNRTQIDPRLYGFRRSPQAQQYKMMIIPRDDNDDGLELNLLRDIEYLDGLIYITPTVLQRPMLLRLAERLPLVVEDAQALREVNTVSVDQWVAVRDSVRLLAERGSRKLGIISHQTAGFYHNQVRIGSFTETVRELGLPLDDAQIISDCSGYHDFHGAMAAMLRQTPPVDGVILPRDHELLGALTAIYESGRQLGRDIRVVSMNETEISRHMQPSLTTVQFPLEEVAHQAFNLLLRQIEGTPHEAEHVLLPAKIVERESTLGTAAPNADIARYVHGILGNSAGADRASES